MKFTHNDPKLGDIDVFVYSTGARVRIDQPFTFNRVEYKTGTVDLELKPNPLETTGGQWTLSYIYLSRVDWQMPDPTYKQKQAFADHILKLIAPLVKPDMREQARIEGVESSIAFRQAEIKRKYEEIDQISREIEDLKKTLPIISI